MGELCFVDDRAVITSGEKLPFRQFLGKMIGPLADHALMRCGAGSYTYRCENDPTHEEIVPCRCDSRWCPDCESRRAWRDRGRPLYEAISEVGDVLEDLQVVHVVGTVPREYWDHLDYADSARFKRCMKRTLDRLVSAREGVDLKVPVHSDVHWTSSRTPGVKKPHIDALALCFFKRDKTYQVDLDGRPLTDTGRGRYGRWDSKLTDDELEDLKRYWGEELEREFGWEVPAVPVVNWQYATAGSPHPKWGDKKVKFWCRYATRPYVKDLMKQVFYVRGERVIYRDGTEQPLDSFLGVLDWRMNPPRNYRQGSFYGPLADSQKRETYRDLGLVYRTRAGARKEARAEGWPCRVPGCGGVMIRDLESFQDVDGPGPDPGPGPPPPDPGGGEYG